MNADEQELTQALVAADAAGDTAAATRIAAAIHNLRAQKANLDQMSGIDKFMVGVGRGFNDVGQGLKQLSMRGAEQFNAMPEPLKALTAMASPATLLNARNVNKGGQTADQYTAQVSDELTSYEPLKQDSPWLSGGGRLLGNVAAMPIPAGAGATLLGRAGTSALAGAAQGAVQFVPEGGSRATNTALGATIGALIPGIIQGGKVTVSAVRSVAEKLREAMPHLTQAAREQTAAKILREAVANPANLAKLSQPSQLVAGTRQTLAEATDDRGLASLQNTLANLSGDFKNQIGELASQNNAARVGALRGAFGGADEASAAAIEQARDKATAPLLAAARKVVGVNIDPVLKTADKILKAREGNDTVSAAVQRVRDLLARDGMDTVQKLHNARQEIGTILSGKSSMDQAGRTASRELLHIRQVLDTQIGRASPEFRKFLKQYADMSREADKVRMGGELLNKAFANADALGNPVLSPAKFAMARRDLDRVAQQATGFRKQTADRLMSPDQLNVTNAVGADLDRVARVGQAGTAIGSNTAQNLERLGALRASASGIEGDVRQMALSSLPIVGKVLDRFNQFYGEKVMGIVREVALDPARAQALLAKLPQAQAQRVSAALQNPQIRQALEALRVAGPGTTTAAVVGGQQQQ